MGREFRLSIADKLLLSAYGLEESGKKPFSAEDLVVGAWREFPDAFGLAGYRDIDGHLLYPDSNRVFAEIMGSKPIRKKGFLIKVGSKMYQLTEAGREHARMLAGTPKAASTEKAAFPREIERMLKKLITSRAFDKFRTGSTETITFHDACAFWGISPRSSAIEFEGRLGNALHVINLAREAVKGRRIGFDHGRDPIAGDDIDRLVQIHDHLLKTFHREIQTIKKRTDERR
jgi:hypothetical protein